MASRYCFYRDITENRGVADFGIMTEVTARSLSDLSDLNKKNCGSPQFLPCKLPKEPVRLANSAPRVLVKKAFSIESPAYTFGFQGGEPTITEPDYFKTFVRLVREADRKGSLVRYTLQTNGTLIDAEWTRFLKQENFLIDISFDGPRVINDTFRMCRYRSPSYSRVMAAVQALQA